MGLGFIFTGVGGYGLYYLSRAGSERESRRVSTEAEFHAKLSALQKENGELQERLRLSEDRARAIEPVEVLLEHVSRQSAKAAPQPAPARRPLPAAVKVPPPPGLVDWAGASLLEEMIELSAAAEPERAPAPSKTVLGARQRAAIIAVLRKHSGRTIAIHSVDGDSAGFEFARELKEAFVEAGWRVDGVDQVGYVNPPAGLLITSGASSSPEETIIPHEALATAGLDVYRGVDSNAKSQTAVLLVGTEAK